MTTVYTYQFLKIGGAAVSVLDNLNPNNLKQDCCDGGGVLGEILVNGNRLFLQKSDVGTEDFNVQANQTFAAGEVVKIDTATAVITKLTVAPAATDTLAVVAYKIDNTTASAALGKAQPRASVIVRAAGLNQAALVLPATIVFSDVINLALTKSNLLTVKLG